MRPSRTVTAPCNYPLFRPRYPLLGALELNLRVLGGSWRSIMTYGILMLVHSKFSNPMGRRAKLVQGVGLALS